jgi:GTP-binding protein Era
MVKSGFVGLVGRTNVGKSTLVNKILGQKIMITTDKVQTTRNRVNCIFNTNRSQIIFMDCPGFFKPRNLLGKRLNNTASGVISDADIVVMLVDTARGIGRGDFYVMEMIKEIPRKKMLLLNKIDIVRSGTLKQEKKKLEDINYFDHILEVSAKTGENLDRFLKILTGSLEEGPRYYGENMITDQPQEVLVSEIVREKLFNNLSEELPHSITVEADSVDETKTRSGEKLKKISCNIYTEKLSQKAIIIGKSGNMLKKVGAEARKDLEALMECRVFLQLWVKVKEDWTKKEIYLNRFGY